MKCFRCGKARFLANGICDKCSETHKELHEGIGGNGETVYLVETVDNLTGSWLVTERFDNKEEALSWIKWA